VLCKRSCTRPCKLLPDTRHQSANYSDIDVENYDERTRSRALGIDKFHASILASSTDSEERGRLVKMHLQYSSK